MLFMFAAMSPRTMLASKCVTDNYFEPQILFLPPSAVKTCVLMIPDLALVGQREEKNIQGKELKSEHEPVQ